ncbi:MFS transporter [Actinoplanes sichuanensis]|uniref:MFS transporter n=1 Tax=Actinoplanes sichuanensis TaxID=512349 RepID=A0ABW4AAU7_9ACTN|nr:MFS transporter [Actinoplanes sichuanensis]BEL08555.1 MFS transporter [Actinoplanes sichuanensis]
MTAIEGQTLRQLGPTVYLPSAVFSTGIGAVAPVIVLTATGLGASPAAAAVVAGLLGLGQISGSLPAGVLISRVGERRTMLFASALAVPALLACMFAANVLLLGAAVALLGVCGSAWALSRHAYLTEAVRPELRARAMSTLGGVGRIGTFTGPFLGAGAMHLAGLDGAYLVAIAGVSLATVVLVVLPPVPHDRAGRPGTERPTLWTVIRTHRRTLRTLGFGVLLVGALRASRQTILPLWGVSLGLSPATIGLIYGVSGGIDMLLFYPAGKLMDRYGRRAAAVPAMTILGLAHLLLPLAGGATGLTAVGVLMGLGNGLSAGLVMTLGADASPSSGRAEFLGAWRLCSDIGQGGGPLLIGAITAAATLGTAAITVGGSGLLAAYLLNRWITPPRPYV